MDIFEANIKKSATKILKKFYRKTNCSACREKALMIMDRLEILDCDLKKELKFDCDENIREIAKEVM